MSTRTLTLIFTALILACCALGVMWNLAASERDEALEQLAQQTEKKKNELRADLMRTTQRPTLGGWRRTNVNPGVEPSVPDPEEAGAVRVAELERQFYEALEKNDRAALAEVLIGVLDLDPAGYPALVPVLNTLYEDKGILAKMMELPGGVANDEGDSAARFARVLEKIGSGGANPLLLFLASSDELNLEMRAGMLEGIGQLAGLSRQQAEAAEILGEVVMSETEGQLFDAALAGLAALATPEAIAILSDKADEANLSEGMRYAVMMALSNAQNAAGLTQANGEVAHPSDLSNDLRSLGYTGAPASPLVTSVRGTAETNLEGRSVLLQDPAFKVRVIEMATMDPDPVRRQEALGLLVSGLNNNTDGEAEAVAIIEQAMPYQSVQWRQTAVAALGRIYSTESSELLKKIQAQDPDEKTRKLAAMILQEIPEFYRPGSLARSATEASESQAVKEDTTEE